MARVIDGAVLVAAKLHSGRETDLRDVLVRVEQYRVELLAARVLCRLVELLSGVSASYRYPGVL